MFVVRCPKCHHTMRYQPVKEGAISDKKKTCVYCNHTFKIHPDLPNSRIEREEEKHSTDPLFHSKSQEDFFEEKLEKE